MLTKLEIVKIRKLLSNSYNPIYLFDNDVDGICSYLILKKHFEKGQGIAANSAGAEGIDPVYLKLIDEERPDLVVILDKAVITQKFIDSIHCEVLIIDHHPLLKLKRVNYFNPQKHKRNVPTSYMAYQITQDSLWLATIGCIFDYYTPDFIKEFKKMYPDLLDINSNEDPGYLTYETKFGELLNIISFNVKGKNIAQSLKQLESLSSPYDVLNQLTPEGEQVFKKYQKFNKEYLKLFEKARKEVDDGDMIVFTYPSMNTSFTREVSNKLNYMYPNRTVIVAREKDNKYVMSLRNSKKNIGGAIKEALINLDGFGGGHEHAGGCSINKKDFNIFISRIKELMK
ncbi:DHH family phosphoesterase [Candidatus Woesearchaeota archaeon]|nr:DHH family phosphoesterase [Candidatus Woesearchaeota archaeon]